MSINFKKNVQQHMGYLVLHKIDFNTQQVTGEEQIFTENKFSQAAISAVLTAV